MPADVYRSAQAGDVTSPATVAVWDIFVRVFHWSLAICFAVAWLTVDEWDRLHEWAGYTAATLVAARVIWGFVGTKHARFSDFIRGPRTVLCHVGDILCGRDRRYLGHNPAGGAMIIALLIGIGGLGVSGWMMTIDAFWGVKWVEALHEALANGLLVLVGLHVAGALLASLLQCENLIVAMLTGRKYRN